MINEEFKQSPPIFENLVKESIERANVFLQSEQLQNCLANSISFDIKNIPSKQNEVIFSLPSGLVNILT